MKEYIKSENILKGNKYLTFFNNYNKYRFAPANFAYPEDANAFNRNNIIKWKNYIDKYLVKQCGDVFCHYQLQNGVRIVINYPYEYNQVIKESLLQNSGSDKYKYQFVFLWMMNVCFYYKINMLDAFILIFYITNEGKGNKTDLYSKIMCNIAQNICGPVEYNTGSWFNDVFNDLGVALIKQEKDNFEYIKNLMCKKGKKYDWYADKLSNKETAENVKRALNNCISIFILIYKFSKYIIRSFIYYIKQFIQSILIYLLWSNI